MSQTYAGALNLSLQELASDIALQLGEGWSRSTRFDNDDAGWRAVLEGPDSQELFISNTWASKGRLYIAANLPKGCDWPYKATRPEITVRDGKSAVEIAKDITRRLIPPYLPILAQSVKAKADREAFEAGRQRLAAEVAIVVNGKVNGEMVYSKGWDLQVSCPESIRINGNCNYLTLEQLKKIQAVCPELFQGKGE